MTKKPKDLPVDRDTHKLMRKVFGYDTTYHVEGAKPYNDYDFKRKLSMIKKKTEVTNKNENEKI